MNPESRTWIIPVTIDDSVLIYTPEQMEGFEKRRAEVLGAMDAGYMILKARDQWSYNLHEFRTNNYFYYLSGYPAHEGYLILEKQEKELFLLSVPAKNIRRDIYEGEGHGAEDLQSTFGADRVLSFREAEELLAAIIESGKPVYVDKKNRELMDELDELNAARPAVEFLSAASILDDMRVYKDPMEVERLQKACNITALSLKNVMKHCKPGTYEYEMEAIIEGCYLEYGSAMPGFSSIVGSGPNSTILHYEPNTRLMESGDLLLMDVGADYAYYTADITRTIPVNGKFSSKQAAIYQLVLDAQKASIELMKPGNSMKDGHKAGRKVIGHGLAALGLISDTASEWQVEFYCIHGTSHFLGMDVHDVGKYRTGSGETSTDRKLEPGMVLTVEPGVYIREKGLQQVGELFASEADSSEIATFIETVSPVYEAYINTGVRIEDDILITKDGNLILSRYAPKEIEDIELLMRLARSTPR